MQCSNRISPIRTRLLAAALLTLTASVPASASHTFIVQGTGAAATAERVRAVGGTVTHELGIIDAVAAELTLEQEVALARQSPALRLYPDAGATTYAAEVSWYVADSFGGGSFGNNDGSQSWSTPWIEEDPEAWGAGPHAGQVRLSHDALRLDDSPNSGQEPSIARQVDLSGTAVQATLSF